MSEQKEQTFVAQKCGESCTCHDHIKQNNSKDIPEATISAHLIRGVVGESRNEEIANKNANVHNFLAHLKYRILGAEKMSRDENLSIFDNPPELLEIHDNGFDKKTEISEDQQAILDQLNELIIGTPADIKTFVEKITQIDCNTDGLDKLINDKLKDIKCVIREHNKNSPGKQLTLDDLSKVKTVEIETQTTETETKEDRYRKEIKDIIKEELSIDKKNKIKNLTEERFTSLTSSQDIKSKFRALNNKYNNTDLAKTHGSLYETVGSFVTNKEPAKNISLIEKILNFLGIKVYKNIDTQTTNTQKDQDDLTKAAALAAEQNRLKEDAELEKKEEADALKKELEKQKKDEADALKKELEKQKKDEADALKKELEKQKKDEADALKKELEKQKKDEADALKKELEKQKKDEADALAKQKELEKQKKDEADALAKQKELEKQKKDEAAKEKQKELADKLAKQELEKKKAALEEKQKGLSGRNYDKHRTSETDNNVSYLGDIFTSCPIESFYKHKASGNNIITYVSPATSKKTSFLEEINGLIGVSIPTAKDKETSFGNNKARYDAVEEKYKKYIMSKKTNDGIKISIIEATALSALDKSLALLNSKNKKTDIKIFLSEMNESLGKGEHISKVGILPKNLLLNMIYEQGIGLYNQETLKKAITDKKVKLKTVYDKIRKHNNDNINYVGDNVLKKHLRKIESQKTLQK